MQIDEMEHTMQNDMYLYERAALEEDYKLICGVDEAGRGPLAGPVYSAAVILPTDWYFGENIDLINEINDSKKLSEKKREKLYDIIIENAVSYSISFSTVEEIEQTDILKATLLSMKRAIEGLNIKPDIVLIDGNQSPSLSIENRTIIGGDALSASIAAASILAKVSRDRYMLLLDKSYPDYQFSKHKGYGTKLHCELLLKYGASPVHRKKFLRKILGESNYA
jgi:ribonuclease HII